MTDKPTALVLFSGGLDSILAAKLLLQQGIKVKCIHFSSPFFGSPKKIPHWQKIYDLDIVHHDISDSFIGMLAAGPKHGFGKALNPCIDCKILLLSLAKGLLSSYGADFLATGEVTGQRPMSQRKDTMNLISREAGVRELLLRPLCAKHQPLLPIEIAGEVDHSLFPGISGRGRSDQLELARKFNLSEIPTPAGGCLLTEKENTRRYWKILKSWQEKFSSKFDSQALDILRKDMELAIIGRQLWQKNYCLNFGRNQRDNEKLGAVQTLDDVFIRLSNHPGPHALARGGITWPAEILASACALIASYSPRAVAEAKPVSCDLRAGQRHWNIEVMPERREELWSLPDWEATRAELRQEKCPKNKPDQGAVELSIYPCKTADI